MLKIKKITQTIKYNATYVIFVLEQLLIEKKKSTVAIVFVIVAGSHEETLKNVYHSLGMWFDGIVLKKIISKQSNQLKHWIKQGLFYIIVEINHICVGFIKLLLSRDRITDKSFFFEAILWLNWRKSSSWVNLGKNWGGWGWGGGGGASIVDLSPFYLLSLFLPQQSSIYIQSRHIVNRHGPLMACDTLFSGN